MKNSIGRKVLLTLVVLGTLGSLAGFATFAAFSSTTSNTGNVFAAGTVHLTDNDLDAVLYNVSNQKPGVPTSKCIKVTYAGSLDADVKLYASAVATVGQYIDFTLTRGTGSAAFPGCGDFTATGGAIFTGTLKGFADTHSSYANGLVTNPLSATKWIQNDALVYKFDLVLQDDNSANGGASALSTGSHSFTWEARNQ